ncbi:MAG: DUF2721 domain-containing protein [Chakrabartia sp.]
MTGFDSSSIAQTIQLALTPIFILVAIGNFMNVLTGRLSRIVDRSRLLQGQHVETEGVEHDRLVDELRKLDTRIHLINRAVLFLVLAAITIGITVGLLFIERLTQAGLDAVIASAFFGALMLLMLALVTFLRETRIATALLRIPETYLELDRTR